MAFYAQSPTTSSPIHIIPPPHYTTQHPIPCPNFNEPGSDNLDPATAHNMAFILDDADLLLPALIPENKSSDDLQYLPQPLPPPPTQIPLPLSHQIRFLLLTPSHLTLLLLPLPSALTPTTHQNTMSHASGLATMPSAHSKHVPSFTGDINEPIKDFLQEYEELADSCRLTNRQKVEAIIWYIDPSQHDLWKSLEGYTLCNWDELGHDLRQEYINPMPQGQYSKQKLVDLTNRTSGLRMEDEGDVIKYYRSFNLLSKPLLDAKRIT